MQRITAPLDAARALWASRPASNGSVPPSMSRRARWVVRPMPRPSRCIHFTQRALRLIEGGTEPFEAGRLAHNARAASNGAVMRCIPVALRYHDNVDKMVRVSTQQAAITHADQRCTWGAAAVNLAARELLHGNQHFVEEVLHRLQGGAPRPLVEAIRRVPWEQESDLPLGVEGEAGYVVHCVEIAFWCAMHRRRSRRRSSFWQKRVVTPTPTPPLLAHCSARGTARRASRPVGCNSSALRAVCPRWPSGSYKPKALSRKSYDLRLGAGFTYALIRSITSLSMSVIDTQRAVPRPRQLNRTARRP